jgi:polar amino acid transport system substrate-binding protein
MKITTLIIILLWHCIALADVTQDIEYIIDDFPPFNFIGPDGNPTGINVDILYAIFQKLESSKGYADIKLKPWARGYNEVQIKSKKNVLFSMSRIPQREKLFKWVGPLTSSTTAVFTLAGNPHNIEINDNTDLRKYIYTVVREDSGEKFLRANETPDVNITTTAEFLALPQMVGSKRTQAFVYNVVVAKWLLKTNNFPPNKFDVVYAKERGRHYFAFNNSIDDAIVAEHQKALDTIKSEPGTMEDIYNKYH